MVPGEPIAASGGSSLRAQLDRVAAFEATLRPTFLNRVMRRVGPTRPFIAVYRRVGPRLDTFLLKRTPGGVARLYGFPALTLISTGAVSGRPRESPVFYVRDGDDFVIVGTNFGTEHHPAWTGNLLKQPAAQVRVGAELLQVDAELLGRADFERLWPSFRAIYPGYDTYLERLTHREPRMFALHPRAR